MEKVINLILENIQKHGISAVFFGSMAEEMIAPIPSPIVMMGAGFMLLKDYSTFSLAFVLELLKIALVGGVGALIGSYFIYALGYFGGKPLVERTKKFTGIKWSAVEKLQARLEKGKSDEITIGALRAIPVMPAVVISITCGLLRINLLSYTISFYIGGVIRNIIFLVIGWQIGEAYKGFAKGFDKAQNVITILIALAMIGGLAYLYWRRHKQEKLEGE